MNDAGGSFLSGYLPPEAEEAIALQFAALHKEDLKYVPAWGWLCWTGSHWRLDDTLKALDLVRALCRDVAELEPKRAIQKAIASAKTTLAVERLARSDRRLVVPADVWDRDPWLLCTPDGIVDLRTGTIRPAERTDYMTKCTAVPPGGDCPLWLEFLELVCARNRELIAYLARVVGYLLTPITWEHVMFFLYGKGGNGKTTFVEIIMEILADYARSVAMELLVETNGTQHPTGLASLRGARLAKAVETEEGRSWALGRIKAMTGGDRLTARLMRRDFFDFDPAFKLLAMGNHRPKLRRVDQAIRRRLHLIPFTVTIIEPDRQFRDKLRGELPGILAWAIEGCLDWQKQGLAPPPIVRDASVRYFEAEDAVAHWLEERTERRANAWTAIRVLSADFRTWCQKNGEDIWPERAFVEELENRGFQYHRFNTGKGFNGLQFISPLAYEVEPEPQWWQE
jgi:putative DNA primase/helicase